MNGLHFTPLQDTERIYAMADRGAREAALLALPNGRHYMVAHFLILKFAAEIQRTGTPDAIIDNVPAGLVEDVRRLARSYTEAARLVAESKA